MEKRVLEHYLETGKPLAIPGLLVREEVGHRIDPVGVYSTWAEPSQGWVPSMKSLREEVIRLRTLLDAGVCSEPVGASCSALNNLPSV